MTLASTMACRGKAEPSPSPSPVARPIQPLSRFGIVSDSRRDQWRLFERAFAAAHAEGFDLVGDAGATYRHDGPLTLDGVSFDGRGCTLGALSDGPQVLRCIGKDFRIANLRILGAATARHTDNWHNGIWIGDEGGQSASDFVVENVTVDAVAPGRGVATAGFMFNDAHRGRILRPVVRHSFADGIHVTNGSSDLLFDHPLSEATGDDGFAVVSYVAHGRICRRIRVLDGISRDSAARGFTVVGGVDVVYARPLIERSAAAGLYFYGEESFNTYGVARCRADTPMLRGCVTGRGLPADFNQGAITLGGRAGEDRVDGERIARAATDCTITAPVVEGVGRACRAAIITEQYAVRPRITKAVLNDIVAPSSPLQANGIDIGGRDVTIEEPRMRNVAGIAIVVTRSASGTCTVTRPHVDGSRLRGGPVDSVIYADRANDLTGLVVRDGVFLRGPRRLSISLVPSSRIRLLNNSLR